MMNSAREHYEEAERLLALLRTEQDSIRRHLILAEAQVHATLALSASAGEGPAGPGQDRAADTKSTGTAHQTLASPSPGTPPYAHPRWPKGTDQAPAGPAGQPDSLSPGTPTSSPLVVTGQKPRPDNEPVRPEAVLLPPTYVRTPSNPEPHAENPPQAVPGTVTGQPGPGDPGKEKPAGKEPADPEQQDPGGPAPVR
jgi:hypothetical protein